MVSQSRLLKRSCLLLLVGGSIGCSALAELGIAVPDLGDPPLVSVDELARKKRGAIVHIKGIVRGYAPFLNSGAYQLQDPSGLIWIRTAGQPPRLGQEVVIKGKLDYQSIPVGNQELGEFYVVELEQLEDTARTPAPTTSKPTLTPVQPQAKPDPTDELFFPHKQQSSAHRRPSDPAAK
jgi:hypothetical protein